MRSSASIGLDITFVDPQSPVMRILGDKIRANLVAQSAGVSVPPWNSDGLLASLDADKRIPLEDDNENKRIPRTSVTPKSPDSMVLGAQSIEVRYREQADGSIYAAYGVESHQIFAKEEALSLRMVLNGVAVLLPTLDDPRSDITGKLLQDTVEDGATVRKGESFPEAEAMKMIITLKADGIKHEGGVIKHEKPAGSIMNQGDLLASLTLADPSSRVKKIGTFSGTLEYATGEEMVTGSATLKRFRKAQKTLELVLDGYVLDAEPAVQAMLSALASVNLPIEEIKDAASALGQKMLVELDAMMQKVNAATLAEHVNGMDSTETAKLVTKVRAVVEESVKSLFESKQANASITFAPVTAKLVKYAKGLRENAVDVTCALFTRYVNVESMCALLTHYVNVESTLVVEMRCMRSECMGSVELTVALNGIDYTGFTPPVLFQYRNEFLVHVWGCHHMAGGPATASAGAAGGAVVQRARNTSDLQTRLVARREAMLEKLTQGAVPARRVAAPALETTLADRASRAGEIVQVQAATAARAAARERPARVKYEAAAEALAAREAEMTVLRTLPIEGHSHLAMDTLGKRVYVLHWGLLANTVWLEGIPVGAQSDSPFLHRPTARLYWTALAPGGGGCKIERSFLDGRGCEVVLSSLLRGSRAVGAVVSAEGLVHAAYVSVRQPGNASLLMVAEEKSHATDANPLRVSVLTIRRGIASSALMTFGPHLFYSVTASRAIYRCGLDGSECILIVRGDVGMASGAAAVAVPAGFSLDHASSRYLPELRAGAVAADRGASEGAVGYDSAATRHSAFSTATAPQASEGSTVKAASVSGASGATGATAGASLEASDLVQGDSDLVQEANTSWMSKLLVRLLDTGGDEGAVTGTDATARAGQSTEAKWNGAAALWRLVRENPNSIQEVRSP